MPADPAHAEDWSGDRVERWLRQAAGLERQLAAVLEVLMATAALAPGESVLDVGCGTGPTTYAAASAVGPSGFVCGLDISAEMLAAAAATSQPDPGRLAPIEWVEADAVRWRPEPGRFDAVISRFGVMFFSDPAAAFTNPAAATRPGGRLAMAVWQRRDRSELFSVSLRAALDVLCSRSIPRIADGRSLEEFAAIDGEGPFSMHDADRVRALLSGAGWADVSVVPRVLSLPFAGGVPPAPAAEAALDFGPTRAVLVGMDHHVLDAARQAIAAAFAGHTDSAGNVVLSGAINVVTARRPG